MRFKSLASSSNCLELALEGFPRPLQTSMSSDGWSPFCCGCLCGSELVGDGVEELEGEGACHGGGRRRGYARSSDTRLANDYSIETTNRHDTNRREGGGVAGGRVCVSRRND